MNCRYTRRNRAEILNSRVDSTRAIGDALRQTKRKPKVWLNSSTATIYSHALDRAQTESPGEIGKGFSVQIAKEWEGAFFDYQDLGMRLVALRSAMVFGKPPGGVYEAYRDIVRKCLGGKAGSGEQFVSWLHAEDFVGMIEFLLAHPEISGPVNLASPEPVRNREFMRALRESLGVPFGFNASECMLEIGAVFLRTETELLLKSRRVIPERLMAAGYQMRFPRVKEMLDSLR